MWTVAQYVSTSLFSLKPYNATTSGGKSLIVPTPFAVKMALLDAAIRTQGLGRGQSLFSGIRDLQIAIQLPPRIMVNKTFTRVLRIWQFKGKAIKKGDATAQAKTARHWPYQKTIAFREYVQYGGALALGFYGMPPEALAPLLIQINYLGKRGGFMQFLPPPITAASLPDRFTMLTEEPGQTFPLGVLQMVDDCGPGLSFDRANVYSDSRIRIGQDRIFRHVVLPYRPVRSSKSYTLYERMD